MQSFLPRISLLSLIVVLVLSSCGKSQFDTSEQPLFDNLSPNQELDVPETQPQDDYSPNSKIWEQWTESALKTSMRFEGGDFANITGNFDGAGLTCGSLGWTIKWSNQQPLVFKFVSRYGLVELKKLMPQKGSEYWNLVNIKDYNQAITFANKWSKNSANVLEPYRSELQKFWKDPRMMQIQYEYAWLNMGKWAREQALIFSSAVGINVTFRHFSYFFDQAVLNGTSGTPTAAEGNKISLNEIYTWIKSYKIGYTQVDFQKNRSIWMKAAETADADQILLFKMAYLRALKSRDEFKPVTMNRRASLALGAGYVNGVYFQ